MPAPLLLLVHLFADPLPPAALAISLVGDPRLPSSIAAMATVSIPVGRTQRPTASASSSVGGGAVPTTPAFALALVMTAWRLAGLSNIDTAIDDAIHRSRLAGLLPELRLRAMHDTEARLSVTDDERTEAVRTHDSRTGGMLFEARLTFRFDRLLYGDDEPPLERLRDERRTLRLRVLSLVVEAYGKFLRAEHARNSEPEGSLEREEAFLRAFEARATLDALTEGAFTRDLANGGGG